VLVLLLSVAAFAVDLVHAYFEAERAQKAADAAALAGAAQIPADTTCAHATTTAHLLAADNKEADGVDRTVVTPRCSGADEMTVDVEHTFDTMFAKIIGIDTLTVRRRAVAQYDPPLQMGSAVNYLGDVPSCPPGTVAFPGCKAQVGSPPARLPSQHMWAQIQGRDTDKSNGDPYTTNVCNTAVPTDGCNGAGADTNLQFDGNGEWFLIQNLTGGPLDVWIYDAQFSVVSWALAKMGLITTYIDFLGEPWAARLSTIGANIWRGVPFVAICLLAGLQTINPELQEAAAIDGARAWQRLVENMIADLDGSLEIARPIRFDVDGVKRGCTVGRISQMSVAAENFFSEKFGAAPVG